MMQRMDLHLSGIKVPKLGSVQDRVYRQFLDRKTKKEVTKNKLMALLVANVVPFESNEGRDSWSSQVRKVWTMYLGLEYGVEIPESSEDERKLIEYYNTKIKTLKPILKSEKGRLVVEGLDSLKE